MFFFLGDVSLSPFNWEHPALLEFSMVGPMCWHFPPPLTDTPLVLPKAEFSTCSAVDYCWPVLLLPCRSCCHLCLTVEWQFSFSQPTLQRGCDLWQWLLNMSSEEMCWINMLHPLADNIQGLGAWRGGKNSPIPIATSWLQKQAGNQGKGWERCSELQNH